MRLCDGGGHFKSLLFINEKPRVKKGVIPPDKIEYLVKELTKLMARLNKLLIEIVSFIGMNFALHLCPYML